MLIAAGLRTGDIAYVEKEDGSKAGEDFFVISDRIKELIKYKGFQAGLQARQGRSDARRSRLPSSRLSS